jgi:hypothetical protein
MRVRIRHWLNVYRLPHFQRYALANTLVGVLIAPWLLFLSPFVSMEGYGAIFPDLYKEYSIPVALAAFFSFPCLYVWMLKRLIDGQPSIRGILCRGMLAFLIMTFVMGSLSSPGGAIWEYFFVRPGDEDYTPLNSGAFVATIIVILMSPVMGLYLVLIEFPAIILVGTACGYINYRFLRRTPKETIDKILTACNR